MKKIITAVLLAMVLSVILTACENTESYMIVSPNDNTRGLDVVMERTTTGSAATGNLTINEGFQLVSHRQFSGQIPHSPPHRNTD